MDVVRLQYQYSVAYLAYVLPWAVWHTQYSLAPMTQSPDTGSHYCRELVIIFANF